MVKLTAAVIGAIVGLVAADNCKPGLEYCGYGLLRKGNYYTQINSAIQSASQPQDSKHINQGLFHCDGGSNGDIHFVRFCEGGCIDGGSDRNYYC